MMKSNSQTIIINPELIPKLLSNKECDLYFLWNVAKQVDVQGNGIINLNEFISLACNLLSINKTYVYQKIDKGVDLYWRKPFGKKGQKKIALLGINHIIKRLSPMVTKSKPVAIPNSILQNQNLKSLKDILVSIFASRYDDNRPVSIETLCKTTSLSESNIRKSLSECPFVAAKRNYEILKESSNRSDLMDIFRKENNLYSLRIIEQNNKHILLKQLPNSYILNTFDRIPFKYRPKELRKLDKVLFANLVPKVYTVSENSISTNNHNVLSCYQ